MKQGFHFFSVGWGSECYTIVLEGDLEQAEESLNQVFCRVKHLHSERVGRKDWHGTRRIGNSVIRACYFSGLFSSKRNKPLTTEVAI